MKTLLLAGAVAGSLFSLSVTAKADSSHHLRADSHAPIGVMGDHRHKKGEWMLSYRFMTMDMEGNRSSKSDLTPEEVATTIPNRFFGQPMQPPTLRVVPTQMTTQMHMLGGMYAPSDDVTLMLMTHYIDRKMDHITFQGGAGTTRLGNFTTKAQGLGDTKASALIKFKDSDNHKIHFNAGVSLPTGDIDVEDEILTPLNTRPTVRLPYAMQLGSGTYDLLPGITYIGTHDKLAWGAQYAGTIRLGRNNANYSLGDKHQLSAWSSYAIKPAINISARVTAETEEKIDGIDSQIIAPVQTADPNNYGGERVSAALGINTVIPNGAFKGHRFSIEGTLPIYQNLNGPQMKRDSAITIGWSKSF